MNNRLIKSNDAGGGGACTNTVDLYNPFPDGGGLALYQLNGNATDVSGNYDGTASNVTYGAGEFGQAGVFNGSSSKITLPNVMSFSTGEHTISSWLYIQEANEKRFISNFYTGTIPDGSVDLVYSNPDNAIFIDFRVGTNYTNTIPSPPTNQWIHIVATFVNNGICSAYLNGSLVDTVTAPSFTPTSYQPLNLGYYPRSATYFNGSIDQVRIFNRALRPYEVEALYTEEYCTPTIVPSEHFNTVLWDGNDTARSITGIGFQPDLVWTKARNIAFSHSVFDSVRGSEQRLRTNVDSAESTLVGSVTSFDLDGFSLGDTTSLNGAGNSFVAWNFKAGGSAVTNTDGTITSQVSVNTEAGFSIVSYTGNDVSGNSSVGHGLGITPKIVIQKNRSTSSNWEFQTTVIDGSNDFLYLNDTRAAGDASQLSPESDVFWILKDQYVNQNNSSNQYINYLFAEVEGFSNFGSYVGTGVAGNPIVTGFEPAFLLLKATSSTSNWTIYDNKRGANNRLIPNTSDAENTLVSVNFLENGFDFQESAYNNSGESYIYMAFAADPTTIEPSLEDSFNTVLYTGNGVINPITTVGFQPDLIWGKQRNGSQPHVLVDSVRGRERGLASNNANAELNYDGFNPPIYLSSFDDNGFTLGYGTGLNQSGNDMVAWCWKAAELPAINSNGSIPSVVSANPAAGFSIVSYTANGVNNSTVGHGLQNTPDFIIVKKRTNTGDWFIYHKETGENKYLFLNRTQAAVTVSGLWGSLNSDTFKLISGYNDYNQSGQNYIAYCFAEVAGFSKFGSYTGNGSTSGPTIDCGFEPAFVMVKCSSNTGDWVMLDNKRATTNPRNKVVWANLSDAEATGYNIDFNATNFQITNNGSALNTNGATYIYMAFANQF